MIAQLLDLLGYDVRILRIARNLLQIIMWVSDIEMRWAVIALDTVVDAAKRLKRAA